MQIFSFLRHIPPSSHEVYVGVISLGESTATYFRQTSFWQQHGKSLYERHIQPLDTTDYLLLGGSLALTAVIIKVAVRVLGIGALALGMLAGAILILGSISISRYRVRKHFDAIAWGHIDQIRRTANIINYKNQKFSQISQERGLLRKPEFDHLEQDLKQLDEEIKKFKEVATSSPYEDKQSIVLAHLTVLKGIVQADAQDKALVEELEQEIQKIGKSNQDLKTLETQKQKLHELKTALAKPHISELKEQINFLLHTLASPHFKDSQQAFINHLASLQSKLASHLRIEPLTDIDPIEIVAFDKDPANLAGAGAPPP